MFRRKIIIHNLLSSIFLILLSFDLRNYRNINQTTLIIVHGMEYDSFKQLSNRGYQNNFKLLPSDKLFIKSQPTGKLKQERTKIGKRFLSSDTKYLMRKVSVAANSQIHDNYVSQQFKWSNRLKSSDDWRPSFWRPDIQYGVTNSKSQSQTEASDNKPERTENADPKIEANYLPPPKYDRNRRPTLIHPKPRPWISKLGTTVQSLKENIKHKFNKLLKSPNHSLTKPLISERSSKVSKPIPNSKGISRISIISSPLAAVLSSLITSLSITSLAFTKEFVFGKTISIPGNNSSSDDISPLTSLKLPFVSAMYALSEVLTSGIRSFLNIPGESSDKRYRQALVDFQELCSGIYCISNTTDGCINGRCTCGENPPCSGDTDFCSKGACSCGDNSVCEGNSNFCSSGKCKCGSNEACGSPSVTDNICLTSLSYPKCVCGSSHSKCNPNSTQPQCLSTNGNTPKSDDFSATCKCIGRLTENDSCLDKVIGYSPNRPLCGRNGVCEECQANRDGNGGRGTGFTKGTCQNKSQVCCPNGECKVPPC